jgi:hypothetical protein
VEDPEKTGVVTLAVRGGSPEDPAFPPEADIGTAEPFPGCCLKIIVDPSGITWNIIHMAANTAAASSYIIDTWLPKNHPVSTELIYTLVETLDPIQGCSSDAAPPDAAPPNAEPDPAPPNAEPDAAPNTIFKYTDNPCHPAFSINEYLATARSEYSSAEFRSAPTETKRITVDVTGRRSTVVVKGRPAHLLGNSLSEACTNAPEEIIRIDPEMGAVLRATNQTPFVGTNKQLANIDLYVETYIYNPGRVERGPDTATDPSSSKTTPDGEKDTNLETLPVDGKPAGDAEAGVQTYSDTHVENEPLIGSLVESIKANRETSPFKSIN